MSDRVRGFDNKLETHVSCCDSDTQLFAVESRLGEFDDVGPREKHACLNKNL